VTVVTVAPEAANAVTPSDAAPRISVSFVSQYSSFSRAGTQSSNPDSASADVEVIQKTKIVLCSMRIALKYPFRDLNSVLVISTNIYKPKFKNTFRVTVREFCVSGKLLERSSRA